MDAEEARSILRELRELEQKDSHDLTDLRRATELHDRVVDEKHKTDRQALTDQLNSMGVRSNVAGTQKATTPFQAIQTAGWEPGRAVMVPPELIIESKALIADAGDAAPLREPDIVPEGTDGRRLFPALPTKRLEGRTRVDELVSTGRVLASPASMQLAIDATTEKPTTSSGATLTPFDVTMVAHVSDPYPNAIVALSAFADLVDTDMTVGYQDALDDLVVNTIVDAAGNSGDEGADLFEQLRKAITVVQGEGFNPTLAAISPEDAETLDLSRSGGSAPGDGPFILSPAPRSQSASPLWDLRLRVVKGLASPIVMDPAALRLYVDAVRFDADPFTGFSTNQTRYRYEGPAALVVRQPAGVFVIAAAS